MMNPGTRHGDWWHDHESDFLIHDGGYAIEVGELARCGFDHWDNHLRGKGWYAAGHTRNDFIGAFGAVVDPRIEART
jgi:hypothetical protein